MPNHVYHRVICEGPIEDVFAFKNLMITDGQLTYPAPLLLPDPIPSEKLAFDFQRIAPMPPILGRVVSPRRLGENGRTMLYHPNIDLGLPTHPKPLNLEATVDEEVALAALPYNDWYDWSCDNWGTKWNSYDFCELDNSARYEFSFNTAWSPPVPVFNRLVSRFPTLTFDIVWFDEGWCHAGMGSIGQLLPNQDMDDLYCEPNDVVYEQAYGVKPDVYVEDTDPLLADRLVSNFLCEDVGAVSDQSGYYPICATMYSDDPEFDDDELYTLRKHREWVRENVLGSVW